MSRLMKLSIAAMFLASGCNGPSREQSRETAKPSSLAELLQAHDEEVAKHGKDLKYIQPIGSYGRKGVLASLNHLASKQRAVSSYNGVELVFGVAEAARSKTGYDLCEDKTTWARISEMAVASDAPAYQRSAFDDLMSGYCKPAEKMAESRE